MIPIVRNQINDIIVSKVIHMINKSDIYVAIIADIVDSKNLQNRKQVQNQLKQVLEKINSIYKKSLAAKFQISLGDEFQGLVQDKKKVIEIIQIIELDMHPVKIRFGIGVGKILTDIDFDRTLEIDGPAYHRARNMIDAIENNENQYEGIYSNIMIDSGKENVTIDTLMNTIFSLRSIIKEKWTNRQVEIIRMYMNCEENQYKTAEALHIGQPTISKCLNKTNYYSFKSAGDTIKAVI